MVTGFARCLCRCRCLLTRKITSQLEPKRIHGRYLTSQELAEYVKAYAKMFKTGSEFPQATTMLAATAEANNTNAKALAVAKYKSEMDR